MKYIRYLCWVYKNFKIFLLLIFSCALFSSTAQPTIDTLKNCLKQRPHLFAKLDTRNSFISNGRAKIFGLKVGLNYGKRLSFGIGYNQLYPPAKNFDTKIYYKNQDNLVDSVIANLKLFYFSTHIEYVFYQTKHWELSMPLQIGLGQTYYKYKLDGANKKIEKNLNFIYEPCVSIEYKYLKWIGIGADVGFRFTITKDRKLNQNFNSPTYAFKLLIYYNEIFKSLFPKSKYSKYM